MLLVKNKKLRITADKLPKPYARIISPFDDKEEIKNKKKFPFKLPEQIKSEILYQDKTYLIEFEKGYVYDGASIPRWIWFFVGSNASLEFLLAALFHDKICQNKKLVNNNRYLSSLIFKELLLVCKVNKFKAKLMFLAVDNFQRTRKWK